MLTLRSFLPSRRRANTTFAPATVAVVSTAPAEKSEISTDDVFVGLIAAIKASDAKTAKIFVDDLRQSASSKGDGTPWYRIVIGGQNHWPLIEAAESKNPVILRLILDCFTPADIKWLNAQPTNFIQRPADQLFEIAAKSPKAADMIGALVAYGVAPSQMALRHARKAGLSDEIYNAIQLAIPRAGDERRMTVQNILAATGSARARQL